jgi:YGGT family
MSKNPYSDETAGVPPHNVPGMEDLPLRPAQPAPQGAPPIDTLQDVEAETRQEEARTVRYAIGKLSDFLQWFMAVLEVTLAIRFLLRLIGADPLNMFAGFLYTLTNIILVPFITIVRSPSLHVNQAFEWSTLIGMAIYALTFWAVRRFLRILISGPEEATS